MNKVKSIAEIRKDMFDTYNSRFPFLREWPWYSYRLFKAKLYLNVGAVLVWLSVKMNIRPNLITAVYALMGLFGGIFLAIPNKIIIICGVIFFSTRSFFDWTDGALARETGQTSLTGKIFDPYSAQVGWIALWTGLGVYLGNKTGLVICYMLAPILPALFAMNIPVFIRNTLYSEALKNRESGSVPKIETSKQSILNEQEKDSSVKKIIKSIAKFVYDGVFEHNARTVDLIGLIIILELFTPLFVSWIVFVSFLGIKISEYVFLFYKFAKGGLVEKNMREIFEGSFNI